MYQSDNAFKVSGGTMSVNIRLVILVMLVASTTAMAEEIRTKQYGYEYGDTVRPMEEEAFVVCGDCEVDKLDKAPKQLIGIRVTMPPQLPVRDAHQSQGRKMASATDANNKPSTMAVGDVLFRFNNKKFSTKEKGKLDRFVRTIPDGAVLDITGYTCSIGSKSYNLKLSEKRAKSVASYLKAKGLAIGKVAGKGECCPVSTDKKKNRRVHITKREK